MIKIHLKRKIVLISLSLTILLINFSLMSKQREEEVLLYAPISLSEAMNEVLLSFKKKNKELKLKSVFMGTSQLVMQVKNGAKPDLFISANEEWMDYLQDKKFIIKEFRRDFLYNSLVLITNKNNNIPLIKDFYDLKKTLITSKTKISLAMTRATPAGIYAKDYLKNIKAWNQLNKKFVESMNVRSALNFVARGDLEYGIVYQSDALATKKVKIVYNLDKEKYKKIIYPIAVLNKKNKTMSVYNYLLSEKSFSIIKKWGFKVNYD